MGAALWQRANYSLWLTAVNTSQVQDGRLDKVKMKMSSVLGTKAPVQLLCNVSGVTATVPETGR